MGWESKGEGATVRVDDFTTMLLWPSPGALTTITKRYDEQSSTISLRRHRLKNVGTGEFSVGCTALCDYLNPTSTNVKQDAMM